MCVADWAVQFLTRAHACKIPYIAKQNQTPPPLQKNNNKTLIEVATCLLFLNKF